MSIVFSKIIIHKSNCNQISKIVKKSFYVSSTTDILSERNLQKCLYFAFCLDDIDLVT